jgi:hypothetical protein
MGGARREVGQAGLGGDSCVSRGGDRGQGSRRGHGLHSVCVRVAVPAYPVLLLQTASRFLRAVGSGILLAPSMHAWRALGPADVDAAACPAGIFSQVASTLLRPAALGILLAPSMHNWRALAPADVDAAACPAGIFSQVARTLLRPAALGILLAPSMHNWRALGPADVDAAAFVDDARAGAVVDVVGAAVLVGALVAVADVAVAAGALDEAALEELELDPPHAARPKPSNTATMIIAVRTMCMESCSPIVRGCGRS